MTTETDAAIRASLRELIDRVPDAYLADVHKAVMALFDDDPALRTALLAPLDDEPITEEDLKAIREGHEEYLRGELIPHDVAMRELGL